MITYTAVLIIILCIINLLNAVFYQKLQAEDGPFAEQQFGFSVAISNDTAVIGAPGDNNEVGSVYILTANNVTGDWEHKQKLIPNGNVSGQFGYALDFDINDNIIIIGSPKQPVPVQNGGAAFIYEQTNNNLWENTHTLVPISLSVGEECGHSVAIDNNIAVIGCPYYSNSGAIYIFEYNGASWIETEQIFSPKIVGNGLFGFSVDVSNNIIVVGAPFDDGGIGVVYIIEKTLSWNVSHALYPNNYSPTNFAAWFGWSVFIDGIRNLVAVGEAGYHNAYIFAYNDTYWIETQQTQQISEGAAGMYGASISIYNDVLAVGAAHEDTSQVYVYEYDSNQNIWMSPTVLSPPGNKSVAGNDVFVFRNTIIIGAPGDDSVLNAAGSVAIYQRAGDNYKWIPTESPSAMPTLLPSNSPSNPPTENTSPPTYIPTNNPTDNPSDNPTYIPTSNPSNLPTNDPTNLPTQITSSPSSAPTNIPSVPTNVKGTDIDTEMQVSSKATVVEVDILLPFAISVICVFSIFAVIGYIDANYIRRNDFFNVLPIFFAMISILDTGTDVFFVLDIYNKNNDIYDGSLTIQLILSIIFIVFPISFTVYQSFHESQKHWIQNQNTRRWLDKYSIVLYMVSILCGSSFVAVYLFNSALLSLALFEMNLSKKAMTAFLNKKFYSVNLAENLPQLIIQGWVQYELDELSIITVVSMSLSGLSIILSFVTWLQRKKIINVQQYLLIEFDVTQKDIDSDKHSKRVRGICKDIGKKLGIHKDRVSANKPTLIPDGLHIELYLFLSHLESKEVKKIFEKAFNSSHLASIFQTNWNLSSAPNVSNLNYVEIESKFRQQNTVNIQMESIIDGEGVDLQQPENNTDMILAPIPTVEKQYEITPGVMANDSDSSDKDTPTIAINTPM